VASIHTGLGWALPLSGFGGVEHPVYATYSMLLALCFGTMGLPHVLVRFYTNPDGPATRRTTLVVLALLGLFYLFPPVYGALGRVYLPHLPTGASPDSITLLLPSAVIPGIAGELLSAILAGGAFAALLSTASGLTICVAGVVDQDLVRSRLRRFTGNDARAINGFRIAAVLAVVVPFSLSLAARDLGLADTVGLAFAIAASTFCPLLILGIWWRRLSTAGAAAGLLVGGVLASSAVLLTIFRPAPGGWAGALLSQPVAWTLPITVAVMALVSLATPRRIPRGTARTMVRLHAPEALSAKLGK
jgi:cation/acetate symporter